MPVTGLGAGTPAAGPKTSPTDSSQNGEPHAWSCPVRPRRHPGGRLDDPKIHRTSRRHPPAVRDLCAARTCGPTAGSNRSTGRPRWATSTSASSRRSAARSPTSSPASSWSARSGPRQHPRALPGRLPSSCVQQVLMGTIGTQAELARVPLADGTLVATPDVPPDDDPSSWPPPMCLAPAGSAPWPGRPADRRRGR